MELYPNIFTGGIWLIIVLICLVSFFLILSKKIVLSRKIVLIGLLSIPLLDMSLGITNKIRDQIYGEIVLSAFDDAPFYGVSITIREKNGKFVGEYSFYDAFSKQPEKSDILIENNNTVLLNFKDREFKMILVYDKEKNILNDIENSTSYRINHNTLLR